MSTGQERFDFMTASIDNSGYMWAPGLQGTTTTFPPYDYEKDTLKIENTTLKRHVESLLDIIKYLTKEGK